MQVFENVSLSEKLWYQIGGRAKFFLQVSSRHDIDKAFEYLEGKLVEKIFVCGLGSNLIFTDEYYDGAVIQILTPGSPFQDYTYYQNPHTSFSPSPHDHIHEDGELVTAFAGTVLNDVIFYGLSRNLVGLEWAGGLPGTLGAGVRGNVGAFGGEIKDSVVSVEVLDTSGRPEILRLTNAELDFAYRHSRVKDNRNLIVLSAILQLHSVSSEEAENAKKTYLENITYRRTRHPVDLPNCGSVFKNIKKTHNVQKVLETWPDIRELVEGKWHGKVSMGYIINRFGFSGHTVGKAQVSEKHANFIVNLGGAKAVEVKTIISEIQEKCAETFGFEPEVEVEIVE